MTDRPKSARLDFVDRIRGIAVLCMLLWHAADAWLVDSVRNDVAFRWIRMFGGMAAPLFITLAGAGAAMKLLADERRGVPLLRSTVETVLRGLEVVVAGYLLRTALWAIDFGAIRNFAAWPALALLTSGYIALMHATDVAFETPARARLATVLGLVAVASGIVLVHAQFPERMASVLRVDVLQAIGMSMSISAAVLAAVPPRARVFIAIELAFVVGLATPFMTESMPWILPDPIAGYLARWQLPPGVRTPTLFPLFPWLTDALFGFAIAHAWATTNDPKALARRVAALFVLGAALFFVCAEAFPGVTFQAFGSRIAAASPRLVPLLRMTWGASLALVWGLLVFHIPDRSFPGRALSTFGKTSMPVYCIHLFVTFGVLASPLHRKLDYARWGVGLGVLVVVMLGIAFARLAWKKRSDERKRGARASR